MAGRLADLMCLWVSYDCRWAIAVPYRLLSSWAFCRLVWYINTKVSEELAAFILKDRQQVCL